MHRSIRTVLVAGFVIVAVPAAGTAQVGFFAGGSATLPTSDYGEYAKTGWMASGGVWSPIGQAGAGLFAEGFYGSNSHSDFEGDKTNAYGAYGGATYRFGDPESPGLFASGKAGLLVHQFKSDTFPEEEGSETQFSYGGGLGFAFPLTSTTPFVLAQYIGSSDTTFFELGAGILFGGR